MRQHQSQRMRNRRERERRRRTPTVRVGQVVANNGDGTVDIELGDSGVTWENVTTTEANLAASDVVRVAIKDHSPLVDGKIGGGTRIARGSRSFSLAAGAVAAPSISHGLGTTPAAVVVTPSAFDVQAAVIAPGSSTFQLWAWNQTSGPLSFTVYWVALA